MNRKKLTLLVSTICSLVLLMLTVVPVLASPPDSPKARFIAVLEQLTEEGVISSEQTEIILQRAGVILGSMKAAERTSQRRTKQLLISPSRFILLRISQALDMKPTDLLFQLKEGKKLAQIAEEQGLSTDELVNELLAPVKKGLDRAVAENKLSQEQAEQKFNKIEVKVNEAIQKATLKGIVRNGYDKFEKQDKRAGQTKLLLRQVAQIVNLDDEELLARLKEGKKIVEIAQEQGIGRDELLESLMERVQDRLDTAVHEGKLGEEKAKEIKQRIEERLGRFIDNFPAER